MMEVGIIEIWIVECKIRSRNISKAVKVHRACDGVTEDVGAVQVVSARSNRAGLSRDTETDGD